MIVLRMEKKLHQLIPDFRNVRDYKQVTSGCCAHALQDLSDNEMGSSAAYAIAIMVGSNSTLTHLSLRGTHTYIIVPIVKMLLCAKLVQYISCKHRVHLKQI